MHVLIVGDRGVGKSTLIRRVLDALNAPVFGFETKKEAYLADALPGNPVYIYEAGKERLQSEGNLVGYGGNKCFEIRKEAFDRFAPKLRVPAPKGCVIVMDELGFMESTSEDFCGTVMRLLDGSTPVLAAVKNKDTPFLQAVRSHPNCLCFHITPENRDTLYHEILEHMRSCIDAT